MQHPCNSVRCCLWPPGSRPGDKQLWRSGVTASRDTTKRPGSRAPGAAHRSHQHCRRGTPYGTNSGDR
jgi:hypothetical protein